MSLKHIRNVRGFFSDYYLGSVFSPGRGTNRSGKALSDRQVSLAYMRFRRIRDRAEGRAAEQGACRERFIRPLLRDVLGFHLGAGEDHIHGLYPTAEDEQEGRNRIVLAYCGAWDEELDARRGSHNPTQHLEQALARCGVTYGVLVTGERMRLIRAPGEGPRGAYLETDLAGLADEEDPASFAAFLYLYSSRSFLQGPDGRVPIEQVEHESRVHAKQVSNDLKRAVFTAAESMVSALIDDAIARGELTSPLDLDEPGLLRYRDAALLALYRILFILYAEARDPRLDEHTMYRDSYSGHELVERILHDPERAWPENRCSIWEQLRALFRIYDQGLPPITPWRHIPPRGSTFFSHKTPEGGLLDKARLPDRAVARLLLDLASSTPRRGVGRERVSFRELDIENLGAVYEGLLEYEPRVASDTLIELSVQGRSFVLPPDELVRLCTEKGLRLRGDRGTIRGTAAERLHPEAPGDDAEGPGDDGDVQALEDEDDEGSLDEEDGVKKGAIARLVRRVEPGAFYFVPGSSRKASGSYYTPRELVRDLVCHALGPLVEGKTSSEIERLRVLDPACGSAHFLVEAMRFLGQALHRAYVLEYGGRTPPGFRSTMGRGWDSDWEAPDERARAANSEARAWCKRRVAERCLFGVDLNPTAVELARVALWIESAAGDRPLTYFDHHIRCGNSILGSWMARLEEPPLPQLGKRNNPNGRKLFEQQVRQTVEDATRLRMIIDAVRPEDLQREGIDPESTEEQDYKEHLRRRAEATLRAARILFDLRSASAFVPEIWREWDTLCGLLDDSEELEQYIERRPWWDEFEGVRDRERFFHWELEFPEVFFSDGPPGFDAVLGNPPWDKIKPDRKEFFGRHDVLIRAFVGGELDRRVSELEREMPGLAAAFDAYRTHTRTVAACLKNGGDYRFHDWEVDGKTTGGDPDAFKFFVERAWQLAREGGRVGLVVPSALYNNEGCTGLRRLILEECAVERFYCFENRKKLFPIDPRYKFVCLVFRKGRGEADSFEAAFMRHSLEELEATARYRGATSGTAREPSTTSFVPVRRRELECLSPGTLAFLEYRDPRDREIVLRMYGYDIEGQPVAPRALLRDQGPGTWNARLYSEFHMTSDRDLWTDPSTNALYNPRHVLGPVPGTTSHPPYYIPAAWPDIRARMAEAGFWPLYEGKHIEQFLVDIRPIERWVSLEACEKKYGKLPDGSPKLVFRDIARNTDERTCIAAVLPHQSCAGHTLVAVRSDELAPDTIAAVLNAFTVDYVVRLRTAGTHLSLTHVLRLAIPHVEASRSLPVIPTESGVALGVVHISQLSGVWQRLWAVNRAVAEAYDLTPDDLERILSTFPVFARKRAALSAYFRERLGDWKREVGSSRGVSEPVAYVMPTSTTAGLAADGRPLYPSSR